MAHAQDYWTLKKAYTAIDNDNLLHLIISCHVNEPQNQFQFGCLVSLAQSSQTRSYQPFTWCTRSRSIFSHSAFYLGCLDSSIDAFRQCLRGFRNCCTFIDYTAVGLPFRLEREDVLYNLVSLQPTPSDPSDLRLLSIQSISSLLLNQLDDNAANIAIENAALEWA